MYRKYSAVSKMEKPSPCPLGTVGRSARKKIKHESKAAALYCRWSGNCLIKQQLITALCVWASIPGRGTIMCKGPEAECTCCSLGRTSVTGQSKKERGKVDRAFQPLKGLQIIFFVVGDSTFLYETHPLLRKNHQEEMSSRIFTTYQLCDLQQRAEFSEPQFFFDLKTG